MLTNTLLIYFIPGLAWSLFFTGILVIKEYIHIKNDDMLNLKMFHGWEDVLGLAILFVITWVFWPWSFYYNLPQMVREGRL